MYSPSNRSARSLFVRSSVLTLLVAGVGLTTLARCGRSSNTNLESRSAAPAVFRESRQAVMPGLSAHLAEVGVTPVSICVAGLSSSDVSALVAAGRQYLANNGLDAANSSLASSSATLSSLEVTISRGLGTDQDLANLQSARASVASASSDRALALGGLRTAVLGAVSQTKSASLQLVMGNGSRDVPAKYQSMTGNESGWISLRDAAAAQRAVELRGGSVPETATQTLTAADADPNVVASSQAMTNNMAGIRMAWTAALQ